MNSTPITTTTSIKIELTWESSDNGATWESNGTTNAYITREDDGSFVATLRELIPATRIDTEYLADREQRSFLTLQSAREWVFANEVLIAAYELRDEAEVNDSIDRATDFYESAADFYEESAAVKLDEIIDSRRV